MDAYVTNTKLITQIDTEGHVQTHTCACARVRNTDFLFVFFVVVFLHVPL